MAKSYHMSRKDFVTFASGILGTIMGAVVGLPAISYLLSPALKNKATDAWIQLGPLENYPVGVPTPFSFTRSKINGWEKTVNSYGVYVWRLDESKVTVISNVCTHLSCRVTWHDDLQEYICPCHDGHFAIDGEVTAGPAPRALDRYETKIEEGILSIRLLEG
jgi:Rieske Fe-S protein